MPVTRILARSSRIAQLTGMAEAANAKRFALVPNPARTR